MKILLIGNKKPDKDISSIVDEYDIVARVSKMEWMPTGLIGTKTSILFLEANIRFQRLAKEDPSIEERIARVPKVYVNPFWDMINNKYPNVAGCFNVKQRGHTTSATGVFNLIDMYPNEVIDVACFDIGQERYDTYLKGAPFHVKSNEVEKLQELLEKGIIRKIE